MVVPKSHDCVDIDPTRYGKGLSPHYGLIDIVSLIKSNQIHLSAVSALSFLKPMEILLLQLSIVVQAQRKNKYISTNCPDPFASNGTQLPKLWSCDLSL